jgi:hypothetical protein
MAMEEDEAMAEWNAQMSRPVGLTMGTFECFLGLASVLGGKFGSLQRNIAIERRTKTIVGMGMGLFMYDDYEKDEDGDEEGRQLVRRSHHLRRGANWKKGKVPIF